MRHTVFGFNQQKAIELNLSLYDLLLLNYIQLAHANPKMKHIVVNEVSYVFISHSKIHEDIPILNYTEGSLKNKLLQFKKQNILDSQLYRTPAGGTRAYYTLTKFATEQLFEEYAEVIPKLPHTSSENDLTRHSEMTSYNKLGDSKLEDSNNIIINNNTAEPSITDSNDSNTLGRIKRRIPNMNDDFSDKSYSKTESKKEPKLNLYQKMINEVDSFTDDERLKEALHNYVSVRLAIKDKPIRGINQWKGQLTTLSHLSGDKVAIVEQATARGWAGFWEINVKDWSKNTRDVFAEDYGVKSIRPEDVEGGESSGEVF